MSNQTAKMTFGSDPEFMIHNREGRVTSAINIIPEDKYNPRIIGKSAVYHDNVMIEATLPPAKTAKQAVTNFSRLFKSLSKQIGENEIVPRASATFEENDLNHPDAIEFGCSPETCAYTLDPQAPPKAKGGFRSAGGHIHLGRDDFKTVEEGFLIDYPSKAAAIRLMDAFIGLPLVIIDNDPTSIERKKLYGKAGRCRATAYGVEYRTLSNFWLSSPKLVEFVYGLTQFVFDVLKQGKEEEVLELLPTNDIIKAINTGDKQLAQKLIETFLPKEILDKVAEYAAVEKWDFATQWGLK